MRVARLALILLMAGALGAGRAAAQGPGMAAPQSPAGGGAAPMPPTGSTPFLGGVPSGEAKAQPLTLSISEAINRGLEHNLGILTAEQAAGQAQGARWTALSSLLPTIGAHLSESRQILNLAAYGFPLPPGTPALVGPFNVFDARIALNSALLDFNAINGWRAQQHNEAAARYGIRSARDLVVLVTANAYLESLAASARADAAKAQLDTAQALFKQAQDLKANGIIPAINVLRAEVELSTQQQRATATANDFEKSKLQLARVIGLPIGQAITLSDQLPAAPVPEMTLQDALDSAYKQRADYQAALERVQAASAARAAAVSERLPSVHVNADYGDIGLTPGSAQRTYTVAGTLNVPLFNGGKTHGHIIQADAELKLRQSELADMKAGIYYDVKTAFLDLQASNQQLQVATRAKDLAATTLTQARDRFAAGVADNIEVVQAQESVALANEQYIAALYSYNVSKAALARALGIAEQAVRQYLGGSR